ncbi:hypothetical protein [Synechococcus sp. J7-Johnson]|uniref:hypothetical protein n=1 Tax=Synechococcus sp. J7-Johnson TaxID=2823737 RepID=UPI0020CFBCB6|nr:hypothetical protein [Synechococcus sp. J7-Johnson]
MSDFDCPKQILITVKPLEAIACQPVHLKAGNPLSSDQIGHCGSNATIGSISGVGKVENGHDVLAQTIARACGEG